MNAVSFVMIELLLLKEQERKERIASGLYGSSVELERVSEASGFQIDGAFCVGNLLTKLGGAGDRFGD